MNFNIDLKSLALGFIFPTLILLTCIVKDCTSPTELKDKHIVRIADLTNRVENNNQTLKDLQILIIKGDYDKFYSVLNDLKELAELQREAN